MIHGEALAGDLVLIAGCGNRPLAEAIAAEAGLPLWPAETERFPDGETHVQIEATVRGRDVYLIQPTGPPVNDNLMELLLLADAARRAGAGRVTAVVPYFGYARQDRRAKGREAIGARMAADLLAAVRIDRVVSVDLHSPSIEGFLSMPLDHLTAVPLLAEAIQRDLAGDIVVVSPDLGAVKLAERYARILDAPVAVVQKTRLGPRDVKATNLIGDVAGKSPVIVDDMISTGGTIEAAVKALLEAGSAPEITVAATHGLFVGDCRGRFAALPIRRLLVSDSLPVAPGLALDAVSLAPLLAEAIVRMHRAQPVSGLLGLPD